MKKVTIVMISSTLLLAGLTTLPRFVAAGRPASHRSSSQSGGTLVLGSINPPTIINPVLTSHSVSMTLMGLLFNRLMRFNSHGEVEPDLVESWNVTDDGLEYTFYLKKDIFFHDGKPLTAEDVAFTYRQIIHPANQSPFRGQLDTVKDISAVNPLTVKFTLKAPKSNFLYELAHEILPRHYFTDRIPEDHPFNFSPIGTGPFRFVSWDKSTDEIHLVRNESYFEGPALLEKIVIKVYPDLSYMLSAFLRGEVDLVKFINAGDVELISEDPTFDVFAVNSGIYYALVYDLTSSLLTDPKVRRTIAEAINVREIIDRTYDGNGHISTGPFHSDSPGFNRDVRAVAYNPVRSKLEFMHRGWLDTNDDGILEKDRNNLELVIFTDRRKAIERRIAKVIRQQLSAIGIDVTITLYDNEDDFIIKSKDEKRPRAWLRYFRGISHDSYKAGMAWHSQSTEFAKWGHYSNPQVDALFDQVREASTQEEKEPLYQEIHRMVYEDQPACFLFYPVSYHAVSAEFVNTGAYFSTYMPVHTLKDWSVVKTP